MKLASIKILPLLILLVFASSFAQAVATANYLEIDHIRIDKSGKGYVTFKQDITYAPTTACIKRVTPPANTLAFDTNQAGGKAIYSMLLAAQASGKRVFAIGADTCETYPEYYEDWSWGKIN